MGRVSAATTPSLLVSVPEAARLLGLGQTTVYEMVLSGELKAVTTTRRRKLIPRSEIERFASIESEAETAR